MNSPEYAKTAYTSYVHVLIYDVKISIVYLTDYQMNVDQNSMWWNCFGSSILKFFIDKNKI